MIAPLQSDDTLLADIEAAQPTSDLGFCCWWLGQSGFLTKIDNSMLLFDPYLSDSLTVKYAETDKPHVRMSRRAIDPQKLPQIDVVTSTHNHTDHLDAETLCPILENHAATKLVIPEANREFVSKRLGIDAVIPAGCDQGQSVEIGPWTIHGVAAAHNDVALDDHGRCRYLGYVVEFETTGGRRAIYHSGDTLWHAALVEQLRPFDITLALLPINGNLPTRRVSGNLWGQEAATLAKTIGADLVVPCHYNMFTFNTVTPDAFVATCQELQQLYRVLQIGERLGASVD